MIKLFLFCSIFFINIYANELKFNSQILRGELENGFKYYILRPTNSNKQSFIHLRVEVGSGIEDKSERGFAHFIEHLSSIAMMKNLNNGKNSVNFSPFFNAHTSLEKTTYEFQTSDNLNDINLALKAFFDTLSTLNVDEKEFENEKKVVASEALFLSDKTAQNERLNFYYKGCDYENKAPIGDIDLIKKSNFKDVRNFYYKHYVAPNLTLLISSNLDSVLIEKMIENYFINLPKAKKHAYEFNINFRNKTEIFYSNLDEINFYIEEKKHKINDEKSYENMLLSRLLSVVFSKIYDDFDSSGEYFRLNLAGKKTLNVFNIKLNNENKFDELDRFLSVMKFLYKGVDEEIFLFAKQELLREIFKRNSALKRINSNDEFDELIGNLENKITPISQRDELNLSVKIINNLTIEKFNIFIKNLFDNRGKIYEIPDDLKINLDDILRIYNNAKQYDFIKNSSKIIEIPKTNQEPIQIKSINFNRQTKAYEILFFNNLRLFFRPAKTDGKVYISALNSIGLNRAKNQQISKMAVSLSNRVGILNLNKDSLNKLLKGGIFIKNIDDLSTKYFIQIDTKNIKTAFEILHAHMLQTPQISSKEFNIFKQELQKDYKKSLKNMRENYLRKLNEIYYLNNHTFENIDPKDLKKNTLDEVLKSNFSNEQEFIFFIVGDLSFSDLKPLLQKYIATLPSPKFDINFGYDNIKSIDKKYVFKYNFNPLKRDEVDIFFKNNNAKFNMREKEIYQAAIHILKIYLNEKSRTTNSEDKIYSISLNGSIIKSDTAKSFARLSFICDANQGERSADFIIESIQNLFNLNEQYLRDYKKIAILRAKKDAKNPQIMLDNLINTYLLNYEILDEQNHLNLINSLTLNEIQDAIKRHFSNGDFFIGIYGFNDFKL